MAVGAGAEEGGNRRGAEVARGEGAKGALDGEFVLVQRQIDRLREPRRWRDVAEQLVDAGDADRASMACRSASVSGR